MDLQEGKQYEKVVLGEVKNPISDKELLGIGLEYIQGHIRGERDRVFLVLSLDDLILMNKDDPRRKMTFGAAKRKFKDDIFADMSGEFQKVRNSQKPEDNSIETGPQLPFPSRLIGDLEDSMDDILYTDGGMGEKIYEIRYNTAVGSKVDFGVSTDFWIDVVDLNNNNVFFEYRVDLKTNPKDNIPKDMADDIYYFDKKYIDDSLKEKIMETTYSDSSYRKFLAKTSMAIQDQIKRYESR